MKHLYIILSKTNTKVAKTIRIIGKQNYSHVSVSLEEDFSHIYAYGRPQYNGFLLGGLVEESLDRYTLRKNIPTPIKVLKIEITDYQYKWIKNVINEMLYNPEYMYNLYSILTYPITKGIYVKNTFTCVEFAVYILQYLGYLADKPAYKYKPDEISQILNKHTVFEGDAREILPYIVDDNYYKKANIDLFIKSVYSFFRISRRSLFEFI